MLVLLVIFMVTAPMLQQGVDVNLPKAATGNLSGKEEQLVVSVNSKGDVFIGDNNKVNFADLAEKISVVLSQKPSAGNKVYVKADQAIDYGKVMSVIGELKKGGASEIGLVADLPDES
ncbi:UNVERIFIED_CONTAM: hypothetical protein GTU68_024431 [Idotea baltica]|nr:hypothetical protein [Idotea baltica]